MSARRSTSSTAPASSTTARCCSRERPRRWSPTSRSAASTLAKASRSDRAIATMGLGPRLDIRVSQSLVMTQQLQAAIKLLALTNQEIEAVIAEELARNPLLEARGGESGEGAVVVRED